jgi:hypothetical protein
MLSLVVWLELYEMKQKSKKSCNHVLLYLILRHIVLRNIQYVLSENDAN